MKWNDFTNWLRRSSAEYESQVNVDEIWSGLEAGVDAINRKGGYGLRNMILALLLAGVAISGGIVLWSGLNSGNETVTSVPSAQDIETSETYFSEQETIRDIGETPQALTSEAREEAMKDQLRFKNVSSRDLSNAPSLAKDNKDLSEHPIDQPSVLEANVNSTTDLKTSEANTAQEVSMQKIAEKPATNHIDVVEDQAVEEPLSDEIERQDQEAASKGSVAEVSDLDLPAGPGLDVQDEWSEEEVREIHELDQEMLKADQEGDLEGDEAGNMLDEETTEAIKSDNKNIANQGAEQFIHEPPALEDGAGGLILPVVADAENTEANTAADELAMITGNESMEVKTTSLDANGPIGKKKRNLCPNIGSYKGKKWAYFAGVEAGAAYSMRSLSSTGPDADQLLTLRDERETSMAKINYGFAFSAVHPSGFNISSGFGFSNLLERYEFTGTKSETEMVYGVVSIAINPYGDTTYTMGDIPVTTTTEVNKKIYNKYNYFEIPVLIGYQREVEHWTFGLQGGVTLGLITSAVGEISDENGDEVSIFDLKDDLFRTKFSANYYLGGKVAYNTRGGLSIYLSPNVRFAPHDATSASYPVSSKYVFIGGSLGVAYKFGR